MQELGLSNFDQNKSETCNDNIFGNEKSIAGAIQDDSVSIEKQNIV